MALQAVFPRLVGQNIRLLFRRHARSHRPFSRRRKRGRFHRRLNWSEACCQSSRARRTMDIELDRFWSFYFLSLAQISEFLGEICLFPVRVPDCARTMPKQARFVVSRPAVVNSVKMGTGTHQDDRCGVGNPFSIDFSWNGYFALPEAIRHDLSLAKLARWPTVTIRAVFKLF